MKKSLIVIITIIALILVGFAIYFGYQAIKKSEQPQKLEKVRVQAGWLLNGELLRICLTRS